MIPTPPTTCNEPERCRDAILAHWAELGISSDMVAGRGLPFFREPRALIGIGDDIFARAQWMALPAALAWRDMHSAAAAEGVTLLAISAFRSIEYQAGLITRKLQAGQPIDAVLKVSAPPGCSEHHSGYAVDVATPGTRPLHEEFEDSEAYKWLQTHAQRYGFRLSYPRDNPYGYIHEPWHWCHQGVAQLAFRL